MEIKSSSRRMNGNYLCILCFIFLSTMMQSQTSPQVPVPTDEPLLIEVWSDVVCPFCYIGKTNLENALKQWRPDANVQISLKSYLLNPDLKTDTLRPFDAYLAEIKGLEVSDVRRMNQRVTQMAQQAGLEFHMEQIVLANAFRAHQLLKFAASFGKQSEVLGKLFAANFSEGKNIDDPTLLASVAETSGLSSPDFQQAVQSGRYIPDINSDMEEAQRLGISSVPYFVFNRQFAIGGAQETAVFLKFLQEKFH